MNYSKIHKQLSQGVGSKKENKSTKWLYLARLVFFFFSSSSSLGFSLNISQPSLYCNILLFYRHFSFHYLPCWPAPRRTSLGYLSHHPLVQPHYYREIGLLEGVCTIQVVLYTFNVEEIR